MIHIVIGTKAQLIKMAPIMCRFRARNVPYRYISTGQHCDTMADILDNFDLPGPNFYLYQGKDITSVFSMFFWSIRVILFSVFNKKKVFGGGYSKNDVVLVHGDTISTLVGALVGRLAGMQVGHVESGLRSFDYLNPFPEELTRVAVIRLANLFFCQDQRAIDNLEGVKGVKVNTRGNTLYDALMAVAPPQENEILGEWIGAPYSIVTLHRYENIGSAEALERVLVLVELVAREHRLLFVLHNPTEKALKKFSFMDRIKANPNIMTIPRLDYFRFIGLLKKSEFVISDGGSNQEECSYLGKPLLLLRKATERQEGMGHNCILSRYDTPVVQAFSEDYLSYARPELVSEDSPSETIVRFFEESTRERVVRSTAHD